MLYGISCFFFFNMFLFYKKKSNKFYQQIFKIIKIVTRVISKKLTQISNSRRIMKHTVKWTILHLKSYINSKWRNSIRSLLSNWSNNCMISGVFQRLEKSFLRFSVRCNGRGWPACLLLCSFMYWLIIVRLWWNVVIGNLELMVHVQKQNRVKADFISLSDRLLY